VRQPNTAFAAPIGNHFSAHWPDAALDGSLGSPYVGGYTKEIFNQ
jgi:hypothetical protein